MPGLVPTVAAFLVAGCAVMWEAQPEGSDSDGDEAAVMDPVGVYDVTMSSHGHVSEGTIEIRGKRGRYHGSLRLGTVSALLQRVEPGAGILHLRVGLPGGTLMLRLAGDGRSFSGNWVLDTQRGTVIATKRDAAGGEWQGYSPEEQRRAKLRGPVPTGRSSRPPHSAQDPS